jgi:hypothetical protein
MLLLLLGAPAVVTVPEMGPVGKTSVWRIKRNKNWGR